LHERPHSPDKGVSQKQKNKLGLVDYNYMPAISNKSRKLAAKRRKEMGLGKLNVEDVLLRENEIKTSRRSKQIIDESLDCTFTNPTANRATKKQINNFYNRQNQYKQKAINKVQFQRELHNKDKNVVGGSCKPKINRSSRSIKRNYNDLIQWKSTADSKIQKRRQQKETDEITSLRTFRSSLSSKLQIYIISRNKE
jgi:hypothetical protein